MRMVVSTLSHCLSLLESFGARMGKNGKPSCRCKMYGTIILGSLSPKNMGAVLKRLFSEHEGGKVLLTENERDDYSNGVRHARGCVGHDQVEHVKVGDVDGPWDGVVKRVSIVVLSKRSAKPAETSIIIPPACQIHCNSLNTNFI